MRLPSLPDTFVRDNLSDRHSVAWYASLEQEAILCLTIDVQFARCKQHRIYTALDIFTTDNCTVSAIDYVDMYRCI